MTNVEKKSENRLNKESKLILVPLALLGDKSDESKINTEQSQPDHVTIKIKLHNFPYTVKEFTKLQISILEVQVIDENDKKFIVNQMPIEADLVSLGGDLRILVGSKILSYGKYTQIRLILGENNFLIVNGQLQPLKIPSGTQTGIKLVGEFTLRGGRITEVQVSFDPQKSIIHNKGQGYILKPTLKISSVASLTQQQESLLVSTLGTELESMIENSNIILQADIINIQGYKAVLDGKYNIILSDVTVNPEDILKDTTDALQTNYPYSFKALGGQVGLESMRPSHGAAIFFLNEKVLVFLKNYGDFITTTNGEYGKIKIQ
jgi:hypothetical protein